MDETTIYAVAMVGSVLGGALGARLSKASVWKGALLTVIASAVQFAIGELAGIDQPLVYSLVFLLAVGLIGGRWGMKMTAPQLTSIVVGGFLAALLAGAGAAYLFGYIPAA